jgi:hypothetical protein
MGTYRVFANFSEVLEIVVEANSEQEASDIAFATDFDQWDLFTNEFDGSSVEELS